MVKTMKRISVWTAFFSFCFIPLAFADRLAISGDYAFLADGDLKVYSISDPELLLDTFDIENDSAVAVVISGANAIVTIDNGGDGFSIQTIDVSSYLGGEPGNNCNENQYLGSFDMEEGVITLPGVAIEDTIYTLVMERRGNSNNWQITFTEAIDEVDEVDEVDED